MKPAHPSKTPRCTDCGYSREQKACIAPPGKSPDFCPMKLVPQTISASLELYAQTEVKEFSRQASIQEGLGYADRQATPYVKKPCKTRIEEIYEFSLRMGYKKVGLAYCAGLIAEAQEVARIFSAHQLEVISVICKVGATPKEFLGLREEEKIKPGHPESMCSPIVQAKLLNKADTDFNVVLGLCVGHDALFFKHAEAPCTVLAVKDRVTGHNPLAAIYTSGSYYQKIKSV